MPRWLTIILIALLFCVVAGVVGGRMLLRRVQSELSEPIEIAIADSVEQSVSQAIQTQLLANGELALSAADLDVNTHESFAGEAGFEVTGNDAVIYGAITSIRDNALSVTLVDMEFSAVPAVENGRIELEESTFDKGVLGFVLSGDAFEQGLEAGINDALAGSGLTPVEVRLNAGGMTITTEQPS
jgi:hypothetical protein